MFKIAICDDDEQFALELKKITADIIRRFCAEANISIYIKARDLANALEKKPDRFHLIMLDIMLDGVNGVEMAKDLRGRGCGVSILFITWHKEFAFESYSVYPVGYLLKPIEKDKLLQVIEKELRERFMLRHIIISGKSEKRAIRTDSILYIKMLDRKIIIHTTGYDIEHTGGISKFLASSGEKIFSRCHKSFIVNISKISAISRAGITLTGGIIVPAGRSYYKDVLNSYEMFFGNF